MATPKAQSTRSEGVRDPSSEILDGILEHIPANAEGRPTLIACALMATWWTTPSRRRIFSWVAIHERDSPRWTCGVVSSRSKAHLLEYVGSLLYYPHLKYQMRSLAAYSGKYFPAPCNLHSPTLFTIRIEHISEEFHICFSAFRETLTYLSLDTFTTSFNAFVALVDYYPNITTLQLRLLAGGGATEGPSHLCLGRSEGNCASVRSKPMIWDFSIGSLG